MFTWRSPNAAMSRYFFAFPTWKDQQLQQSTRMTRGCSLPDPVLACIQTLWGIPEVLHVQFSSLFWNPADQISSLQQELIQIYFFSLHQLRSKQSTYASIFVILNAAIRLAARLMCSCSDIASPEEAGQWPQCYLTGMLTRLYGGPGQANLYCECCLQTFDLFKELGLAHHFQHTTGFASSAAQRHMCVHNQALPCGKCCSWLRMSSPCHVEFVISRLAIETFSDAADRRC